ncbi:hypothetical protein Poli38472_011717 [Pythium oligandrum]|uniref:Mitogen-activated protein kinase n=1 Tax=Pythium oligandrum TaxID=41045 RepID=A0A8K1C7Z9_PYTOL|nr:hypothetical protein Poli38472_011717 [Pythium oligandrum]|eukprot:TMW58129.1 hypothetical protein Poli38472_011717 [Pythium oligandrum]
MTQVSRRESNLTLDRSDAPLSNAAALVLQRPLEPSLSPAQFHTLWHEAALAVRASCSFTRYQRRLATSDSFIGRRRSKSNTNEIEGTILAVAAAMDEDEQLDFQDQLVQCLGDELVVLSEQEDESGRRSLAQSELVGERVFVLYAYTSVSVESESAAIVLLRVEQLHGSEQLALAVKNTSPISETRLQAFMSRIQQRIQPGGAPPKKPRALQRDTTSVFLEDDDGSPDELPTPPTDTPQQHRQQQQQEQRDEEELDSTSTASVVSTPASETTRAKPPPSTSSSLASRTPSSRTSFVGRGRSHTVRYRSGKGIAFEGYLHKKSELLSQWRAVYCVLEGDTLAYYESREDFISNSKLIGRIQVQGVDDDPESTSNGKSHAFRVVTEGHRVHHLSSRTAFEKDQWKRAIRTAIAKASAGASIRPPIAFASQSLDPTKFYRLLGALLRQEINDFPLLFRCMHPDVIVTSNYPPIVPFWGQYRRYDGVLLFISTLLESVNVDSFELKEVMELVGNDADCIDGFTDETTVSAVQFDGPATPSPIQNASVLITGADESPLASAPPLSDASSVSTPSATWERRLVVTGKETFSLLNFGNRRVTQLFVHELWLDHKGRLVRWHMNGDAVALSVAFDGAAKGENVRLVLPGETSSISHSIPPGMFYVQIMRAQQLTPADAGGSNGKDVPGASLAGGNKKPYPVYVRCILQEGTHMERTMDGLDMVDTPAAIADELAKAKVLAGNTEKRRPSASTRLFRGLKRAAGISGERTFAAFGDSSGCVTSICKCSLVPGNTGTGGGEALSPEWCTNLRLEFPGCARGFTYFVKLEVFQSRFMLPDELLGVCKINLTPHLKLFNGSAEAKANGALPRWHNLCDQYNDCRESWAPPTVFRGRIQVAVIFAPTIKSKEALHDPKITGRRPSGGLSGVDAALATASSSRRASVEETLVQSMTNDTLREFLQRSSKSPATHELTYNGSQRSFRLSSSASSATSTTTTNVARTVSSDEAVEEGEEEDDERQLKRLGRQNHSFYARKTKFDVPKKYQQIKVVGSGTYGEVIAASDTETGATVAIKKITNAFMDLPDTKRILRELCLLRQLRHPNLIQLYDLLRPERLCYLEDIYIVTDLMETDLHRVIHSAQTLTDEHVAYFMRQMLRALHYLHSANILHRDLKPSNILVTSACDVKICDLGLARYVDYSLAKKHGSETFVQLTEYVVTRWYRAPEILLDGYRYDKPSDLWSAGCILAELLGRKPLFPGTSTTNQLQKIFNVLGTPDIVYIAKVQKEAAQKWLHRQRRRPAIPLTELYPNANLLALDLLEKLLVYDPKKRLTAAEALHHPYLREAFRSMDSNTSTDEDFAGYSAAEQAEDTFQGVIDDSHERVAESKEAMQDAVFAQICHFHPEAQDYEKLLEKHDQKFVVDPASGKLTPIAV